MNEKDFIQMLLQQGRRMRVLLVVICCELVCLQREATVEIDAAQAKSAFDSTSNELRVRFAPSCVRR